MSSAVVLFGARVLLLVLLYLFLLVVVRSLRGDLRRATRQAASTGAPAGTPLVGPPVTGAPTKRALGPGLEIVDAGQTALAPGRRFPLLDTLSIGRSAGNDITLEDDWISAQHMRLRRQDGGWIAEDLGSTNGTRVNGRPLTAAMPVRPGDVLDLGRVKLRMVEKV